VLKAQALSSTASGAVNDCLNLSAQIGQWTEFLSENVTACCRSPKFHHATKLTAWETSSVLNPLQIRHVRLHPTFAGSHRSPFSRSKNIAAGESGSQATGLRTEAQEPAAQADQVGPLLLGLEPPIKAKPSTMPLQNRFGFYQTVEYGRIGKSSLLDCNPEIHGCDGFSVVAQKCQPALTRIWFPGTPAHPAGDRSFRNIETKHQEFTMNAGRAPRRILAGSAENQLR